MLSKNRAVNYVTHNFCYENKVTGLPQPQHGHEQNSNKTGRGCARIKTGQKKTNANNTPRQRTGGRANSTKHDNQTKKAKWANTNAE